MASFSPDGLEEVVWRVLPLTPPRILRHCRRCDAVRPFAPTEKFRMNAQQTSIDVWLLYACCECGSTWKREVVARRSPREIGAERYRCFQDNDPETARECAFAAHDGPVVQSEEVHVLRPDAALAPRSRITLEVPLPCGARLDRLLAAELGVAAGRCAGSSIAVVSSSFPTASAPSAVRCATGRWSSSAPNLNSEFRI